MADEQVGIGIEDQADPLTQPEAEVAALDAGGALFDLGDAGLQDN